MRKTFFFVTLLFIASCTNNEPKEQKAEQLVKLYLDSLNHNSRGYEIISFKYFHPIYTSFEDDPNYAKYEQNASKLDSIKEKYVVKVRSWIIYVKFNGKNNFGNFGTHIYQCIIDENLLKCVVAIEVNNFP